jgi:hypothetical protein
MPAPATTPMPTIDVVSGVVTNPPVKVNQPFAWTTSSSGPILVYAQKMGNGQPWYTPSPPPNASGFTGPATGPLADGSNVVTAGNTVSPPSGWGYTSNLFAGEGHVVVQTMHDHEEKKAS